MLRNFFSNTVAKCFGFLAICLISASVNADIYDAGGVEPSYTSATDISDTANQWHNRVSTTDAYNVTDPNLTVSISSSTSVSPYSLTFSSSAATSSFVASDVYVTGGTLSSFSGSGSSFSATVTESSSGAAVSIIVPASGFQDNAGNNNTQASLFFNYPDTLNAGADVSKTLGDGNYTQTARGGSGTGAVTYTSSATSVATVSSAGVVTIVGAGSATITATRAADANYNAVSDSYVLIVNAPPGFSLSKTTASVNEDLSTDTFTVVLTAEPASNVVINVLSGDTGEATVAPAALTFTTANWNSAQTVTVTGVNDDLIDGSQTAIITVSVNAASSDDDFDSLVDKQVTATVADNDTAGFSLSKTTASVNEDLSTDTFTVVLTAEPASNVVINVLSGDTGEATVAPAALTFTTANWNSAQTVTVTGVNDDLIDGSQTAIITVSVNAASSDDDFDSLVDKQVTATVADNDTAGFSLSKTTASVNEDLSTDTFTVVLTAEPASNVVINVLSGDTGEATVAPAALTFTTANWNSAQTVTVTGVNDDLIDGSQTAIITVSVNAASSDDDFDSLVDKQVTATVADNDTAGFSLSKTTASVNEDLSTDTFTVVLTAEPASNVVINVLSGDTGEATVAPAALTFTTANWNSAQTVTVTGVNDDLIDGSQTAIITVSVNAASSDDDFDSLVDKQVTATVADNDTAGFSLSKTTASVNEDLSTDTFTVVLTAEPASNVVINVLSGDTGEATVAPAALTFTTANWNSAQTVTVTGVNDDLIDGSQTAIITVSVNAASSDDDFDSLVDKQVTATVADNDTAGFSLSKTTASVNEDLSTDTFTVVLTAEPASNVVINVLSGDTGEATVAPAALTFTTANWNSAQTVTVTGVNDDLIDGSQTAIITVSVNAASSDDDFDSLVDKQVTATVADNDTAGFSLSKTTASVNEDLSTDTFTVVLTAEPASNVVINVLSGDTGEATVAPAALTFTTANWNSAQTVTVTGVNDDLIDGSQTAIITVSVNAASSDDDFDSLVDKQVTATVADNDTAGFSLSKTTASVNEDLSTDTFTVVLTAEPASNVVINVLSGDTGEATVAPAALTFTTANWNSAQTVTVTGVNDDLIDGSQTAIITVSVNAASSDDDFDSLVDKQVTATVADNDTAGFSLSKTTASVNEDLSTDTFTVVLTAEPASNVVINVLSGDTGEATVAPAALTFTTANWNSAQTVTVTGVNDDLIDGSQTAIITVSVNAASSDDDFDSLVDKQVTATVADNDTAGFSLSKTTASVNEDLSTDTFTVVLTAEPASNVVINVLSGDTGEATVAPAALTFTTANWNSAQTVTVTGVNDDLIDGSQTAIITVSVNAASSDDDFDSLVDKQVTATVADNDTAGFSLSKTTASVNEDLSTDTFTVVLTAEPASNVVINVLSGDTGEATVAPAALTFTTANWNSAQTVTVTGVNDDLIDGSQTAIITVSVNAASSDDDFDSLVDKQVTATVADNDTAGFSLSKTTASVNEDLSTDTFTVVLTAEPASNVVINVLSGDTGEATVAPAALTFTTANWNSAQTVTVTGVNDDLIDGSQTAIITVSVNAASSDDDFDSLVDKQVTATVADNDTAGFSLSKTTASVNEDLSTDTFTVVLTAEPASNVVINVLSGDTGEATVAPAALTFTTANWNSAQTVTVTGVNDDLIDGSQTAIITVSVNAASSDDDFDSLVDKQVTATVADNDTAGFSLSKTTASVNEDLSTDTFTVVLTAEPASNVVINVLSGDTGEATVAPAALTFTTANWNSAQTVTVTGVNDDLIDGSQTAIITVSVNAASSDDDFDSLVDKQVTATVADNDTAGFSLSKTTASVNEDLSTDTFTVVLTAEPASNVVINVLSGDTGEATVAPAALTFTTANWNSAQTVTVTGVNDDLIDGSQTAIITVSVNAASSDDDFDSLVDKQVTATVADNDTAGFSLSKTTASVNEDLSTDTFTVVLTAEPASNVVINVLSGDTGEATVAPAALTFTTANWNSAQTVTVTGVNDDLIDGSQTAIITVSVNAASSDDDFDSLVDKQVTATVADNDTAGFSLSKTTASVNEDLSTDTFTVVLTAEPASNVVINVLSGDTGEATVAPAALTFTTANWNSAQTVTVTGVNDDLIDGSQTAIITVSVNAASSDDDFDSLVDKQVTATVADNDTAGFSLSKTTASVNEDLSTDTFTVVLTAEPASNVVINVLSGDTGEATVAPAALTFTTANWNSAQTVTVTGVNDDLIDGSQTAIITVSVNAASSDDDFDSLVDKQVTATVADNDTAGFSLSKTTASVNEDLSTDTFTVVLTAEPASNVVINVLSGDTGEATVAPAALTFTTANWNSAQTVTVTGVNDDLIDGSQTAIITVSVNAASSDDDFDSLVDKQVTATVADNDTAGFSLSKTTASVNEDLSTDTFTVVLTAEPASNVVINVLSGDTGEATVAPAALTFTTANWNSAQTVTVTGVNDDLIDGSQTAIITVSVNAASSDDDFDSLVDKQVTATVADDITAPVITVTGANPATVEQGATYSDAGATADGGETVTSSGTVDTLTAGTYIITYSASDATGNEGTATRSVNVVDTTAPTLDVSGLSATVESGTTALGSVSANESVTWSVAGNAAFAASATIGSETDSTYSVALGDVNGDGHLDVVVGNYNQTNKLYLGDGSGGFGASTTIGSETDSTYSVALGDVNGDGHLDVVVGNYNQTNKLYLGDGSGGFGASTTIGSETGGTLSVALGDVNGDGYLDVVAANSGANKLYLGDGSGGFGASTTIGSETDYTSSITLGDVNGDGHLDVVAGNFNQTNKLYLGDGSGGFGASTTIGSETDSTYSVALGDVNGDGHLDVVAANSGANKLYLGDGSGGFGASTTIGSETDSTYSVALGDVNGDGHLDVVVGNYNQTNKLYLGDGSGGFGASTTIGSETDYTSSITLGDVNGDGHLDVVAGNEGQTNKLYLNESIGVVINSSGVVALTSSAVLSAGSYSFDIKAVDAAGNATIVSHTTTVAVDSTAPAITSATTGTNLAENSGAGQTVYTITATDAVGVTGYAIGGADASLLTLAGAVVILDANPDYETKNSYSFTVTASDAAGNTSGATTVTFAITDVDDVAPVITVTGSNPATVVQGATYSDAGATADGGETVTSSGTVDTSTVAAYTITYSATDAAGNTGTATRTVNVIIVVDTTAPVITIIAGTDTVERGSSWTDAGATADGGETVTSSGTVDTSTVAAYTVTYSATDAAGNTGTATRTVNVIDTTAPVITVIAGTDTVERGSAWTDAGATADGGETVTSSGTVDTSTVAAYTVTYSATDAAGNTGTATRTVNVIDTTAPVITVIAGTDTVERGSAWTDAGATADGGETVTSSGTVDTSTVAAYTVTYSATDAAGNTGTATRTVTVADTVAPVITLLGDAELTLEVGDTFTDAGATATDTVDGDLSDDIVVTGSVDTTSVGSYTLTYNVSDAAGNEATPVTRIVIVADMVAPVITLLGDAELTLEVGDTFTDAGATATDTVDGDLSDDIVVTGSVDTTSVGSYTLTYNVSDAAGNEATPVTRIVIVADMVAPVITLLGDAELTLEVGDTFTDAGATATDTVDGDLSDDIVVTGSVDTTSVGSYTLTYNVSDGAGNAATPVTRIVIVADMVAPVITLLGDAELTLEVGDTFTDAGATATDTVDGDLSDDIVVTGSVDTTSVGSYTLTYNVSDAAGNEATPVTRIVIVADMVAPVITLLGDAELTLEVGDTFTDAGATATDTVDGDLSDDIVVTGSVDTTSVGSYTLTYNVSDGAGNAATPVTRIVIVADMVAPVITLLGDAELTLEVGDTFTDAGATATDTVDGDLSDDIVVTGSVDTTSVGSYTLTYNVSDAAGNAATPVTRAVVVNEIPITIIVPDDITVNAVGYLTAVDLDPQDISFAVDGDGNTLAITPDQFGPFQSGTYEIIWSATNGTSTVTETQILKVVPLVNLGTPITTTEGNNLTIDVILSGTAADYPVSVPFTISGTAVEGEDYTVDPSGMVTISDGTQGVISLSIITDDIAESEESVVITIGEPLNASLGVLHEQIVTIAEENLAPKTALMVSQGDVIGTTVTKDQGLVTATADIDDANADDVHTINWASALNDIPNASVDPETQALIFDPADLDVGVTEIAAEVSDGTNIVTVYVDINIIDQAPVLSDQADSDGDGLTDADEGVGDIDGDNIPDYQDSISNPNVIAADFGVLQSEPGTIITLGARALATGRNVVSLLNKGAIGAHLLEADPAYEFANNLIDFELNGAEFGHSYRLVVPLEFELNEGAVYRKYVNDIIGWQDFIYDANNDILSTIAVDGACPAPGSDVYTPGLTAGYNCIELVIEEGGPNDADGIVNGNLVDPGGVADKYIGTPSELSEVRLRTYKMLANGVDTTVITVNAYDADGVRLDHMSVSASSLLPGAQISEFTAQGNGVYTAILTAGNVVSNGPVTVVIDNGEVSISLRSDRLRLETPGIDKPLSSGGCTVATNGSTDASLLLLLIMSGLLLVRRRYRHNI